MAENGFFKTTFRGFCKEDVLNYIDSLNTVQNTELEAAHRRIAELEEQNAKLSASLPEMEKKLEELNNVHNELTVSQNTLASAQQKIAALEEEVCNQKQQLQAVSETEAKCTRLTNEIAVQKHQLEAQQQQLAAFEKLFGESRTAVHFVRDKVNEQLQQSTRRTNRTLEMVERHAEQLAVLLGELKSQTDLLREQTAAATTENDEKLQAWFAQFDTKTSSDDPADDFFR